MAKYYGKSISYLQGQLKDCQGTLNHYEKELNRARFCYSVLPRTDIQKQKIRDKICRIKSKINGQTCRKFHIEEALKLSIENTRNSIKQIKEIKNEIANRNRVVNTVPSYEYPIYGGTSGKSL